MPEMSTGPFIHGKVLVISIMGTQIPRIKLLSTPPFLEIWLIHNKGNPSMIEFKINQKLRDLWSMLDSKTLTGLHIRTELTMLSLLRKRVGLLMESMITS
jgi:hypothetical protein